VKWDIEKLYTYPKWIRIEVLRLFIFSIGLLRPKTLIGIPTGGLLLANDVGGCLEIIPYRADSLHLRSISPGPQVLIDDVLTTGSTVRNWLTGRIVAVAVLVNRSSLSDISGVPIVSGLVIDEVKSA